MLRNETELDYAISAALSASTRNMKGDGSSRGLPLLEYKPIVSSKGAPSIENLILYRA